MAAKETDKLSEELAQIERDIQTKEQQFLVSIDCGIELKHLHNIIRRVIQHAFIILVVLKTIFIQNNTTNNLDFYFYLGLRLTVSIKKMSRVLSYKLVIK